MPTMVHTWEGGYLSAQTGTNHGREATPLRRGLSPPKDLREAYIPGLLSS